MLVSAFLNKENNKLNILSIVGYLLLRDDVRKNRTCASTIPASVSDRAHILAMDRQSVYKTFLEDDRVDFICGYVR
jgi:hypothetical protein